MLRGSRSGGQVARPSNLLLADRQLPYGSLLERGLSAELDAGAPESVEELRDHVAVAAQHGAGPGELTDEHQRTVAPRAFGEAVVGHHGQLALCAQRLDCLAAAQGGARHDRAQPCVIERLDQPFSLRPTAFREGPLEVCLLYTSDAADDLTRVDLGGRRIIKQK